MTLVSLRRDDLATGARAVRMPYIDQGKCVANELKYGDKVHLQNGYNSWAGGYLDTNGHSSDSGAKYAAVEEVVVLGHVAVQRVHVGGTGHVGADTRGLRAELGGSGVDTLLITPRDDHLLAAGDQLLGDGVADAGRGTGDECDLAPGLSLSVAGRG